MNNKILLAEDEKELAKAVKTILTYSSYDVTVVYNGLEALNLVKENNYDIIIMDVMMPVMDGFEALKEIRKIGIDVPVIFLTAKSQIDDKVEGLDLGANDYLTKPFNKKELLARIRVLTRVNDDKKEKINIGNIFFNKETSEISNEKSSYKLNSKECEIIETLIKNQDRRLSANEIGKKIWNEEEIVEEAIPLYISYLQNKFMALEANVGINIENGYMLEKKL